MKYWLFSLIVAALSYAFGCLSTMIISSNLIFHKNLRRLGSGSVWLSNFRRVHGIKGFALLALTELVKDLVPLLIGGLLFKGHAETGHALAAVCLVLGRCFPLIYGFRGSYASAALVIAAFAINFSLGAAVLVVFVAVTLITRYFSVGTVAGAVVLAAVGVLVIEESVALTLCVFIAVILVVRAVPSFMRIAAKKEEKLSFKEDISYKFDKNF